MEFLDHIQFWHWWVLGLALVALEVFVPGAMFMWMGISAIVVGALVLGVPDLAWEVQAAIWGILSVGSIFVWRAFFRGTPADTDQPSLNRRGDQYIGRVFTLEEAVVNGQGKIKVDDTTWKIESPEDFPEGTKIEVTAVDGAVFKVNRA